MPQHNHSQIAAGEDRRKLIVQLRAQGRTYREIGDRLGISASRANQLHNRAIVLERESQRCTIGTITPLTQMEYLPISMRVINALRYAGFETLADILPLDQELERRLLALPNFARSCLNEVRRVTDNLASADKA